MSPTSCLFFLALIVNWALKSSAYVDHELCGLSNVGDARIFRGIAPADGEFPWIVNLKFLGSSKLSTCTGGILNERWILTTAHCFEGCVLL